MNNISEQALVKRVLMAAENKQVLNIVGGNSKSFYGRIASGDELYIGGHAGVVSYEPSELVITAKAGTKINEIEALLAENKQMLGFEPPFCNQDSTLGGVIAAGLSGPRTAAAGTVRDYVLGVKMINGYGEVLKFGGRVMKNVAGFDHSRLMAGSLGTLGVLLEISLRVIPLPEVEKTVSFEHADLNKAIEFFNKLAARPLPLSATVWLQGQSHVRLSGTENGVIAAANTIGGDAGNVNDPFWIDLKNHQLGRFEQADAVYRIILPAATQSISNQADQIIEWNGGQRWLFDIANLDEFQSKLRSCGGQLTLFRGGNHHEEVFSELDSVSMRLHQNIKSAFDPHRLFNPGRMYSDI